MPGQPRAEPLVFEPVAPTKEVVEWCQLKTVDMSTFNDGPEARKALAQTLSEAMQNQGFFYLTNYGITEEEITRQVNIGHTILATTPRETKEKLRALMQECGTYRGFKLKGYYMGKGGTPDRIEQFNWYRNMKDQEMPETIMPFYDEVQRFTEKVHNHVLHNVLRLFAIALELPEETFVNMHKFDVNDESWMRYMKYYDEYSAEEQKTIEGVWLGGHTDFGSLTLLFSQPMCSLQVRREQDGQWQFVKHLPGGMVVNAGQFMDWLTGGFFKAAIHRVAAPPNDQRNHERCGVFYFVVPNDDVFVETQMQSPVLQRAGIEPRPKDQCTTSKVYSQARIECRKDGSLQGSSADRQAQ